MGGETTPPIRLYKNIHTRSNPDNAELNEHQTLKALKINKSLVNRLLCSLFIDMIGCQVVYSGERSVELICEITHACNTVICTECTILFEYVKSKSIN